MNGKCYFQGSSRWRGSPEPCQYERKTELGCHRSEDLRQQEAAYNIASPKLMKYQSSVRNVINGSRIYIPFQIKAP